MRLETLVTELKKEGYAIELNREVGYMTILNKKSEKLEREIIARISLDGFSVDTEYSAFLELSENGKSSLTKKLYSFVQTDIKQREIVGMFILKINWLTGTKVKYLGYSDNERINVVESRIKLTEEQIVELDVLRGVPVLSMTLIDSLTKEEYLPKNWSIRNNRISF